MNLRETVQAWVDEQESDGYTGALEDLIQHGCESGMVGELCYYTDTTAFYQEHKEEISSLLQEMIECHGLPVHELFGDKWDETDPLANDTMNQNLLAWFAFEETAHKISEEMEQA